MLHTGLALSQALFATRLPRPLAQAIERDTTAQRLVRECLRYLFDRSVEVPSVNRLSCYHLRMRERAMDRMRYVWRSLTTPGVNHFRMVALPRPLTGAYVPIKLAHDYVLLPAWRLAKFRSRRREAASP
jgi:hypothetical protein